MMFSSFQFLGFFLVVLGLLQAFRENEKAKKVLLLLASYYFYASWDWRFLSMLIGITVMDYLFARYLHQTKDERRRKFIIILSVSMNLAILGFFKYFNFFIDSAQSALAPLGIHLKTLEIILPLGVSFITFQSMTYTIDVYRRKLEPCANFLHFALYMTFFPHLIAGPITRAKDFLPQLDKPILVQRDNLMLGGQIFLLGLVKKLLIADNLAYYVDFVYANPGAFDASSVWLATIAYSIQIFADFSGYTDMAIGLARCMGFTLPENFRMPYLSLNITDFWRRWHISLSSWLRDYLYISLGGNRHGKWKTYRNNMITMILGGLWHGASWNFVIWGFMHGLALAVHKAVGPRIKIGDDLFGKALSWAMTYLWVVFAWVFFRAATLDDALIIVGRMLRPFRDGIHYVYLPFVYLILPVVIIAHVLGQRMGVGNRYMFPQLTMKGAFVLSFALFALLFFAPLNSSPFVYFQF